MFGTRGKLFKYMNDSVKLKNMEFLRTILGQYKAYKIIMKISTDAHSELFYVIENRL